MDLYETNLAFGNALRDAVAAHDREQFAVLLHDDFVWTLPGENQTSGDVVGVEGLFAASRLACYQVMVSHRAHHR